MHSYTHTLYRLYTIHIIPPHLHNGSDSYSDDYSSLKDKGLAAGSPLAKDTREATKIVCHCLRLFLSQV